MNLADLQDLDLSNAGNWPLPVKLVVALLVCVIVSGAGYWYMIREGIEQRDKAIWAEQRLREDFVAKQRVMANLDAYRKQIEVMKGMLDKVLRQLPTSTEMPDLLEDISSTGRRNGLQFQMFKPESTIPKEFYAAEPIAIKAEATYHQFGSFISKVAALPRIVTLEKAELEVLKAGEKKKREKTKLTIDDGEVLSITATLQTYRYMDPAEQAALQEKKNDKKGKKKRGRKKR